MSGCCNEFRCRRSQPIRLDRGGLSGRWYFVTRWELDGRGEATYTALEKHWVGEPLQGVLDGALGLTGEEDEEEEAS